MSPAAELRDALHCDRPRCLCRRARVVHCPAHQDRRPSLVVDQAGEKLLVHCHGGCDQREVIAALRARQLWPSSAPTRKRARSGESPLDEARRTVRLEALRQRRRLEPYREAFAEADSIRICTNIVRRARAVATTLGDSERAWDLLTQAADLEYLTLIAEMRLDGEAA